MSRTRFLYFGMVSCVGILLGPLCVLVLEPRIGTRAAQLVEAPLMLAAIVLAGRWVSRRWGAGLGGGGLLRAGVLAARLVLAADLAVGVSLRGMSAAEVLAGRDPVVGPVYYGLVVLTALAPWRFGPRAG